MAQQEQDSVTWLLLNANFMFFRTLMCWINERQNREKKMKAFTIITQLYPWSFQYSCKNEEEEQGLAWSILRQGFKRN